MQSGKEKTIFSFNLKLILSVFIITTIFSLYFFKNSFFESTFILKSFGKLSVEPEIAFKNNKPTFLEFYAEWCEVCKEMAPKISKLKNDYENEINFVFLNVDNPKWDKYIRKFEVNGIPQINFFDKKGNLISTFIGKQEERIINESIENLKIEAGVGKEIINADFSTIKDNKNYQAPTRSHG